MAADNGREIYVGEEEETKTKKKKSSCIDCVRKRIIRPENLLR